MSHEIETAAYGMRQPAWHGLGVVKDGLMTIDEALDEGIGGWEVYQSPVFVEVPSPVVPGLMSKVQVNDWKANVRSTDNKVLGVVGKGYEVFQPREVAEFGESLLDAGAVIETAMSLRGGKIIVFGFRIPEAEVSIAGLETEKMVPYLMGSNGYDGSHGLRFDASFVRPVCANTWNMAMRGAIRTWSAKHTSGLRGRVTEARRALELTFRYSKTLEKIGNDLVQQPFSTADMQRYLETLVPFPAPKPGESEIGKRMKLNVEMMRGDIQAIFVNADNLDNVRNTKWAAMQSVIEYSDWVRDIRVRKVAEGDNEERALAERRFFRTWDETAFKNQALRILAPEFAPKRGQHFAIEEELELV